MQRWHEQTPNLMVEIRNLRCTENRMETFVGLVIYSTPDAVQSAGEEWHRHGRPGAVVGQAHIRNRLVEEDPQVSTSLVVILALGLALALVHLVLM
jgi:hypothetical protein